jgi:thiol-disulfide isomerase/thioredoxin
MRTRTFTFLQVLLAAFLFLQCDSAENNVEDNPNMVNITGNILNRNAYPNEKELRLLIPCIAGEDQIIKAPIEDDGTFHFRFELNQPQNMSIVTYVEFLYLMPGDKLHITLDFRDLLRVRFSGGKAAEINTDFQKYFYSTGYRSGVFHVGTDCMMNCSSAEIRSMLDKEKQLFYEKRLDFMQTTNVRDEVEFLTKAMIDLDYYNELVGVVRMRANKGLPYSSPETLMEEIERKVLPYFSKGLYSDAHFRFMGSGYLSLEYLIHPPTLSKQFSDWFSKVACNDTIRNFALAIQASAALQTKNLGSFEQLYSQIDMDYMLGRLMKEYEYTMRKMNNAEVISDGIKGKPKDMTHSILGKENLLSKTIARGEGKVMVINIWATWCGPCIDEMKAFKELADEYAGQDVTYSFICAGGDEKTSLEMLQKAGLGSFSNHFCTTEEYRSLWQTFSQMGFPFGILVNKKGVIVDYGFHVRPERLREKIDLLLKQDNLLKQAAH